MRRMLSAAAAVLIALSVPDLGRAQSAPSKVTDGAVVAILDLANSFDLQTGQLAVERAQKLDVRDFGRMLARDHRTVRQQGRELAAKLKITPADLGEGELTLAHEAAMKKLRAATDAEFDEIFLQHEVAYHEKMITLTTETLLPSIKNAELKAFVTKIAPAFVAHRDAAAGLLQKK